MPHPLVLWAVALWALAGAHSAAQADHLQDLQSAAMKHQHAAWGHWGIDPTRYSGSSSHSNRLIPAYTFGVTLTEVAGKKSLYRDERRIEQLYGTLPKHTQNPQADYCDQTDIFRIQQAAAAAGKKYIFLIVFDGMDWQTTQAAAVATRGAAYASGRGTGLTFQDYRAPVNDFGFFVSAPRNDGTQMDVNAQIVFDVGGLVPGGYDWRRGGSTPWERPAEPAYLLGKSAECKHAVTDSAASATSLCAGIKTYNDAVNVDYRGQQVPTIAHQLQQQGLAIGIVTSVPISHATPACAYAHNVHRDDYQDLSRDLLGLRSVSHREDPLAGVDVLLGCGWGISAKNEKEVQAQAKGQGSNYVPGNTYLTDYDLQAIDAAHEGRYRVVQRTAGQSGKNILAEAAREAEQKGARLFGFFGVKGGHLPYGTADGNYDPVAGVKPAEKYTPAELLENPTLADMTEAALTVLSGSEKGFWLMIEAGDVDWANHDNNIDNSAGAVQSGDEAFRRVVQWIETRAAWNQSAVIVTADHGHYLVLKHPEALVSSMSAEESLR